MISISTIKFAGLGITTTSFLQVEDLEDLKRKIKKRAGEGVTNFKRPYDEGCDTHKSMAVDDITQ